MKACAKNPFLLPVLLAGLSLMTAGRMAAQTFTNLHSFTATSSTSPPTNSDGAYPNASLVLAGDMICGTAGSGGQAGNGTVFAINTNGAGFTNLYNFTATSGTLGTNSDGADPLANLILSGDTLYGTALSGGASGLGTVFALNTNGASFTNLHSFTGGVHGGNPASGLVISGNALYGTAELGGASGNGIVYRIYTDGSGFTNLHGFTGGRGGTLPQAGLILAGDTLYGTTTGGGTGGNGGNGIVFAISTNGTGFTNLHSFNGSNEGAFLQAGLVLSGNTLYGTAEAGGLGDHGGDGTVFSLTTNGSSFTVLHTFTALPTGQITNSDGANPTATLILSGNTLYGTTDIGGTSGAGTVFALDTDGSNFMNLHSFTGIAGGSEPQGGLLLAGMALYGTTEFFGTGGDGTVFRLSSESFTAPPAEIVSITSSGTDLMINANNGQSGGTYLTLTSINLALPLSQWTPVATNLLSETGDFTITLTNAVNHRVPQSFYILEMP
jgi:uncharacterized repeat protein (TIGR03803 family)